MHDKVEIENIEELRRRQGIDDVELRLGIRELQAGDVVKLTLLIGATSSETVSVRITSIHGAAFRGKLVKRPASPALAKIRLEAPLAFTTDHIHSVIKAQTAHA